MSMTKEQVAQLIESAMGASSDDEVELGAIASSTPYWFRRLDTDTGEATDVENIGDLEAGDSIFVSGGSLPRDVHDELKQQAAALDCRIAYGKDGGKTKNKNIHKFWLAPNKD